MTINGNDLRKANPIGKVNGYSKKVIKGIYFKSLVNEINLSIFTARNKITDHEK